MAIPDSLPPDGPLDPALQKRLERLGLANEPGRWTDRYLLSEKLVDPLEASSRQKFEATSRFVRDLVAHRWVMTRRARAHGDPKRIHYLSLEFLLSRTRGSAMADLAGWRRVSSIPWRHCNTPPSATVSAMNTVSSGNRFATAFR